MNSSTSLHAVRVVVFDLDDTLFPEHGYVHSGFRAVSAFLRQQGLVAGDVFPDMWRCFTGGERTAVFNRVLEQYRIAVTADLIAELIAVYRTHRPDIRLYPDALPVLAYFHGRKSLALLSDGYAHTQTAKIEALGIQHYFNLIVLTDQLGRDCWKPSPAGFEKIMGALGGEPSGYVYIGDNVNKDFAAPRMLGWQTIHVQRADGVYAGDAAPGGNFEAAFQVSDLFAAARLVAPGFSVQQQGP